MVINNKYNFGDQVFLVTDEEQRLRLVSGLYIRPNGEIKYGVSYKENESWHYDFEITKEKDMTKTFVS